MDEVKVVVLIVCSGLALAIGLTVQGWRFFAHPEMTTEAWFWMHPVPHLAGMALLLPVLWVYVREG